MALSIGGIGVSGNLDYGVTYVRTGGDEYTVGGFTERGARQMVAAVAAQPKGWEPVPTKVMVRTCGEWRPVE